MNEELCPRLFAKYIIHIMLLLWQLGRSEFKFQTTAASTKGPLVPDEEVSALNSVAYSLGFNGLNRFYSTSCNDSSTGYNTGIYCNCSFDDNTTCHIEELFWRNKVLKGSLPEEVANLTYLQKLDLSYNEIQGSIPASLGNMAKLYDLDLSNNQLTGTIPSSLGNLKAQATLTFRFRRGMYAYGQSGQPARPCGNTATGEPYCKPRGPCPSFNLDLSSNSLEGLIPDLGSITVDLTNNERKNLEKDQLCDDFSIFLNDNYLNGSIPESLGKLNFLTMLDLHNNLLTGKIPHSLGDLSLLNFLSLSENQLNDSLPEELGNLTSLRYLYLQSNYFTGYLPNKFGQLNLYSFSISGNYLSGPFPQFITNWTSVDVLSFYGNNFWGDIPAGIFNLTSLDSLMISDVGTSTFKFPQSAEKSYIDTLVLRNCSITGLIPLYIGTNMTYLKYLDLSFNNLTGGIPRELENLNLSYMSFANNGLIGPIPAWISRAADRTQIDLSYNNFSDAKYLSLGPQSTLQRKNSNLNLFSCCPSYSLPYNHTPEMTAWIGVDQLRTICPPDNEKPKYHALYINCGGEETELDKDRYDQDNNTLLPYGVSQNGTYYWAFSSSGSFLSTDSNSSDNIKTAKCGIPIPDAPLYSTARLAPVSLKYYGFCLRNGNYSVTLHFAEIIYTEDNLEHSDLKKRIFDVYIQNNMVEGNFHINNTKVNGTGKAKVIKHTTQVENGVLEIHLYWAGKGSSGNPPDLNGPLLSAITVTPNFDLGGKQSRSRIAMITFGSITFALLLLLAFSWLMGWLEKEELHDIKIGDGKTVTLKQLIAATRGFNKEMEIGKGGFGTVYKAELPDQRAVAVKKLSTLSNEGIEKLNVGIYHLQNLRHDNLVRLLDIHVGKDLCFLVYEYMENKSLSDALFEHKIRLNWEARFNICEGIAKGLQYLHEHPRWKMVHWGVKAANILLDGKLKPKISDLGLASTSVENADEANYFLSMMGTEASTGYMAPEYPAIGKKSGYKYDVYSFGVVMLEIVCGRKNVGVGRKNREELQLLVDEVCVADSKGKLPDLVDDSLCGTYDTKQAMTILKLAMKCTHISPSVRPTMSQVVSVLAGDKSVDEISVPA